MKIFLSIPRPLILYAEWHQVEPEEYAQFILDEKGREAAFCLIEEAHHAGGRVGSGKWEAGSPRGLS
jgi:hypothetical protein